MNYKHVIGHYYLERRGNLKMIIDYLNAENIRPFVWNNSKLPFTPTASADIVQSPNNPIHGRYLAALIYPECDYFLFQDDDLWIDIETIQRLISACEQDQARFHGIEGNSLNWDSDKPYADGVRDRGVEATDMVIRCYACHRGALVHGLEWILEHGIHPGRAETLLFTAFRSHLVPGTHWEDLPEYGVGLCTDNNHDAEIDAFIARWGIRP